MARENYEQALWLEFSGLPRLLNGARAGAWPVFKQLVELDCRSGGPPGTVEVTLDELAERCGLGVDALRRMLEVLRRRKYIACYLPDEPVEPALIDIQTPVVVPLDRESIMRRIAEPRLRDHTAWRYVKAAAAPPPDEAKIRQVADLYLNHLSQGMNSLVMEQIQLLARRFPLERIREMMERAERHNLRNIGWVVRELVREEIKQRTSR